MIAIAISLLIGLVAFAALLVVALSTARGIAGGRVILREIAEIDAHTGVSRRFRSLPAGGQPLLFAAA